MKLFVAASYSAKVDYTTGGVFPEYRTWLEGILSQLESYGHEVVCALRDDDWRINDLEPAQAFKLDEAKISNAEGLLAIVSDTVSAGVQMEMGMALAQKKVVAIAHEKVHQLTYFNQAVIALRQASEVLLPISSDPFTK